MKIIIIAIKEIKQELRDKSSLAIMIIFPLILMWILGASFSDTMGKNNLSLGEINVIYSIKGQGELSEGFKIFLNDIQNNDIKFKEVKDEEKAKKAIKGNYYNCYVEVDNSNNTLRIYKNNKINFKGSLIEGILETFIQKYNVMYQIGKEDPKLLMNVLQEQQNKDKIDSYVSLQSLNSKRKPSSLDYYGITMLTMIIMYSMMTGAYSIRGEETRKTVNRLSVSPLSRQEIFIGKTLGVLLVTIIQMAIVIVFSTKAMGVYWGKDIGTILLIIGSEIFMAVSIGVGISQLVKNPNAASGIMSIVTPIIVFLGGGYTPIDSMNNNILIIASKLSPMRWINKSIFNLIYSNNYSLVTTAIGINLLIALLFLAISSVKFIRKEAV